MDIKRMFIVFLINLMPVLSIAYVVFGIRRIREKLSNRINYFALLAFACAIYSFGYYLELNSYPGQYVFGVRAFEFLGTIFLPAFGILFFMQTTGSHRIYKPTVVVLLLISTVLWVLFVTDPIHHLYYEKFQFIRGEYGGVSLTIKGIMFYVLILYYAIFLFCSNFFIFSAYRRRKKTTENYKSNRFLLYAMLIPWITILFIVFGWDKEVDPTPITIMLMNSLFLINEISNDMLGNKYVAIQYELLVTQMKQGLAVHEIICDENGAPIDYKFLSVNESYEKLTGLNRKEIIGRTVLEVLPRTEKYWIETYGKVALTGEPCEFENYSAEFDMYFQVFAYSPLEKQFAVIVMDITEKKQKQEQVLYLSYHDQLTGLFNRRYFEEKFGYKSTEENLPLSLIMLDVNGLKLANDAFGHLVGDKILKKVAEAIKKECLNNETVARIGGDEFVIVLPRTSATQVESFARRLHSRIIKEKVDSIELSVSLGWETATEAGVTITDMFKKAEDDMYRHKLSESNSIRNKTINIIMKALFEKNSREERHSKRVADLCTKLGPYLGLNHEKIGELQTAALMHDIGKISIREELLEKPSKLDANEMHEIKRHSEIGYRILNAANEYASLSESVLAHHERWDGNGYPNGIKGEEIPLYARIISVADSYDAMVSERPYRNALGHDAAIKELESGAGKQFDPKIVRAFVDNKVWE